MNDTQIIYSMMGVSKTINRKEIIKDISLSFYYGAKIGVLGLNGSGKSTLLKIMAGHRVRRQDHCRRGLPNRVSRTRALGR